VKNTQIDQSHCSVDCIRPIRGRHWSLWQKCYGGLNKMSVLPLN